MKHFYACLLVLFAFCEPSRAQYIAENHGSAAGNYGSGISNESLLCPLTDAPAAPWPKEADQVFGHIPRSQLAMMKNASEDLISIFHDSILVDGSFNPVWHGEYFSAGNGAPQIRFGVSCVFHNGDATVNQPNDLTIFANDISPLIGHLAVNGHEFTTLKGFVGSEARPGFEFDMSADGDNTDATEEKVHVKAWLVTADSSVLPYVAVTRKEYLEEAGRELESRKAAIITDIKSRIQIRPATEQEAGKQQALDQLRGTYSGLEQQTRVRLFLASYKSDEDYLKQNIAANTEAVDRKLALIARLLSGSTAQQLAQPAVVSVAAADFHGFEDGTPNSTVLVRLRGSYYSGDTDQATVKSLLICWRYHPSDRMAERIDSQLVMRNPIPRLRKQFYTPSIEKGE
jgi:hypothetical protein